MSLQEQQNFLARLYTDPHIRARFFADPGKVGVDHGLVEAEIANLLAVASDEIAFFSKSLVWKRFREVVKLLPLTRQALGDDFRTQFFDFAPTFNPQSTKKHYEDAVAFSKWVEAEPHMPVLVKNATAFERTRLTFLTESRLFSFCKLERTAQLPHSGPIVPGRFGFAVWLRLGQQVRHFSL